MKKENRNKKEQTAKWKIFWIIVLCAFLGGVCFFLFYKKDLTEKGDKSETVGYEALVCKRNFQEDNDILKTYDVSVVTEAVTVLMRNGVPYSLQLSYVGEYTTERLAVKAEADLHAAYNIFVGGLGIGTAEFVNTYNIVGRKFNFELSAEVNRIKVSEFKTLFFLDEDDELAKMNFDDFQQNYMAKNFSCSIANNKKKEN